MYRPGDHYANCAICGFRFYNSELRTDWQGQRVCRYDFEPRHPQDTIKIRPETNKVKNSRPEPTETFLSPGDVTAEDL